jgi:hypothetical protein
MTVMIQSNTHVQTMEFVTTAQVNVCASQDGAAVMVVEVWAHTMIVEAD